MFKLITRLYGIALNITEIKSQFYKIFKKFKKFKKWYKKIIIIFNKNANYINRNQVIFNSVSYRFINI
jgi:hypothetical protein